MRDPQEESVAGQSKPDAGGDDFGALADQLLDQSINDAGNDLRQTGQLAVDGSVIVANATSQFVGGLVNGDAFFPDNERRLARATELGVDVSQSAYRISHDIETIKSALQDLSLSIQDAFKLVGVDLPTLAAPSTVSFHQTTYEVAQAVAPLLAVAAANVAMTYGSVATEAISGEISAEAAGEALGATTLGLGEAAVLMAAIIVVVGIIEGEERRRKLRSALQERFQLRSRMNIAELYATELANILTGLSSAIKVAKSMGFDPMSLTVYVEQKIAQASAAMHALDVRAVDLRLRDSDANRASWTNEDT